MTTIPPHNRHSPASMRQMLTEPRRNVSDELRKMSKEEPGTFEAISKTLRAPEYVGYQAYVNRRHAAQRQSCIKNIGVRAAFWDEVSRFATLQAARLRARTSLRSVNTEDATNFSLRQAIRLGSRLQKHLKKNGKASLWKNASFKKRGAHLP